jgi:hypothetical protein
MFNGSLPCSAYTTLCRINSHVFAYIHCVHELFVGSTTSRVASGTKRLTHDEMTQLLFSGGLAV